MSIQKRDYRIAKTAQRLFINLSALAVLGSNVRRWRTTQGK
jgi:hypothetical protein